jgi:hypothetical protein
MSARLVILHDAPPDRNAQRIKLANVCRIEHIIPLLFWYALGADPRGACRVVCGGA